MQRNAITTEIGEDYRGKESGESKSWLRIWDVSTMVALG